MSKINEKSKKSGNFITNFIKKILIILLILILLLCLFIGFKTYQNGGNLKGMICAILNVDIKDTNNLKPITFLLLGVSEDIDTKLTDTIMVCQYDPTNQKISLLSIPRDTFIGSNASNAKGSDKINALYQKDVSKTIDAVNKITGLKINKYLVINNSTLVDIVNILGGVKFDVPIDMDYDDPTQDLHIHLKKGLQKLNGDQVEQLLRFRHNNDGTSYPQDYGDNDFGRMKTQREFIKELAKQTLSIKTIFKILPLYNNVYKKLETNLSFNEIKTYIPCFTEFDSSNITSVQLPGESTKLNNLWFFDYSKSKTQELIKELF